MMQLDQRDLSVLEDPLRNKGTAFSERERTILGLRGLVPPVIESLDQQIARAYQAFREQSNDLARHINLRALQDTNEVLFHRLVSEHVEEMLPVVYTPTVGLACERFSDIYRRPRGLFLSYPDRGRLREVLRDRRQRAVDVIVATDGERILGLGDQGAGGMGIPIGKLSLYTQLGGIHPARTLPIVLDVGTDNPRRLADPMYVGWRHERITGQRYDDFVDEFVQAVKDELPGVLLQWEDFSSEHALPILERYRNELLTFNDDIQGTAAVATGALSAGATATGVRMREQKVVMLGAGSAGLGVCEQIVRAMVADGLTDDQARARVFVLDKKGLLTTDRPELGPAQRRLAQPAGTTSGWSPADSALATVVDNVAPTALIGLSTAAGAFTEQIVGSMARRVQRPIILPLSNPTSHAEAVPQDLADWTEGRALVATGSPFPAMRVGETEIPVAQCNNVCAFPGIGLAVVATGASRITDPMMTAAATAIGRSAPILRDPKAALLPSATELRSVAFEVAFAVARQAFADGVAETREDEQLSKLLRAAQWMPAYDC